MLTTRSTDGFILSSNTDDGYHIDAALLPRLTAAQTVFLTHIGYYRYVSVAGCLYSWPSL